MDLKTISKVELESMNYDDIAFIILTEEKKSMKINELFKKICDLLTLSDSVFEEQIADFFEIMTTDKRFTMLEDGSWDLRKNHSQKIIIEDDLEEDEETVDIEEDIESEEEEIFYEDNPDDDEAEDDLKDLVILDEDEEANE